MISEPVASILRSGRDQYNARFAIARRRWPELDPQSFTFFFESFVAPIVAIAEVTRPGCAVAATEAAYDVALELVGQRLAGSNPRHSAIHALWAQAIGPLAPLWARDPARLLPALNNAAHQLATTSGARAAEWITELARLGRQCTTPDDLLRLGQVLAWRCGLAHFRIGALATADALPETLALAATGAPAHARWGDVRARFAADPWWDPRGRAEAAATRPTLTALVGDFRGFDGLFLAPPLVAASQGHLLVRSGDEVWLLTADVFGATLHRATAGEAAAFAVDASRKQDAALATISRQPDLAAFGSVTSSAVLGRTLALTGSLTHRVALAAL
jgi:hypothetical protein